MHGVLPNVRDHDLSVYLKAQGSAMAIGGYETNPEFWAQPASDFAFGRRQHDWPPSVNAGPSPQPILTRQAL